MDLFKEISQATAWMVPFLALAAGLLGSLHCVGMCGGLVVGCASTRKSNLNYQFGRLLGYLFLGTLAGSFGHFFLAQQKNAWLVYVPVVLVATVFIYLGVMTIRHRGTDIWVPKCVTGVYARVTKTLFPASELIERPQPFLIGLLSIFLPCGFLYAIVMSVVVMQNVWLGVLCMFFFWLGTVPAMVFAPGLVSHLAQKIMPSSPRLLAGLFIGIGLLTSGMRAVHLYWDHAHHKHEHNLRLPWNRDWPVNEATHDHHHHMEHEGQEP